MTADISIDGNGFFAISGNTESGNAWIREHVDGSVGDSSIEGQVAYSDDQGYTKDIAQGATDEGLVVAVNGFQYLSGGARGEAVA